MEQGARERLSKDVEVEFLGFQMMKNPPGLGSFYQTLAKFLIKYRASKHLPFPILLFSLQLPLNEMLE